MEEGADSVGVEGRGLWLCVFFFFNDTATTEIYTLSLHDALPISLTEQQQKDRNEMQDERNDDVSGQKQNRERRGKSRSEEHTSELQSPCNLVCRLLLEKKKKKNNKITLHIHIITKSLQHNLIIHRD